jgi:rhodanese-related sulfurtransferase
VTIVEKTGQLLPIFDFEIIEYLEGYLVKHGLRILKDQEVKDFKKDKENKITSIKTSAGEDIAADILFISVGTSPDSVLARESGLEVGGCGAVEVDEFMQTSDPDIFAAGDCCECLNFITGRKQSYNLATIANIQGRTAGYNAAGGRDKFTDSIPTSIIKILDLAIGKTGIGFREAKSSEVDAAKIELHFMNHAGYYPGATMLHMIAVYNTGTGDILGFQAIGFEDVDKKIDVMSTAIRAKMKIWDLINLNLGYHPQYGSAKDPLNILGMIGENIKKGELRFMDVEELKDLMKKGEDIEIIDVRTVKEYNAGHIEGAVNIPLDELRDNIGPLDKDNKIVVYCRSSYRSYLAYRILKNAGFKHVWNLNGSYMSWVRKI